MRILRTLTALAPLSRMIVFRRQFDDLMVDYVNERFEFYKKMEDNPLMKDMVCREMYSDYQKSELSI